MEKDESVEADIETLFPLAESMERLARNSGIQVNCHDLEIEATKLWNILTIKLKSLNIHWLSKGKLVAALAIGIQGCLTENYDRALHCMLRVVECSLEFNVNDSKRAMDSSDWYFDRSQNESMNFDYYTAKLVLALKSGEFSAARVYFEKFDKNVMNKVDQEEMSTQVYNICVDLEEPVEWLLKILDFECIEQVCVNSYRLLVQKSDNEKAEATLNKMKENYVTKIETYLSSLELIKRRGNRISEDYEELLMKMVFNAENAKDDVLCWIFKKIGDKCNVFPSLDYCLTKSFSPLLFTKRLQLTNTLESMSIFLEMIEKKLVEPLDTQTVETAVTILWKKEYFQLCLHRLFHLLNPINKAKIQRRLMQYYSENDQYQLILDTHNTMTKDAQNHPFTQAQVFKYYCQYNDIPLACQCLSIIANSNINEKYKLLAYCISYTRDSCVKELTIHGMKIVLDTISEPTEGINIPSLIRAAAQMCDNHHHHYDKGLQTEILKKGLNFDSQFQPNDRVWLGNKCYQIARKLAKEDPESKLIPLLCDYGIQYLNKVSTDYQDVSKYILQLHLVYLYSLAHTNDTEAAKLTKQLSRKAREINPNDDDIKLRLIIYDLSAVINLQEYTSIPSLCNELLGIQADHVECAVNVLLNAASEASNSGQQVDETIKGISTILKDQIMAQRDLSSLSQWIRVFIGVSLPESYNECVKLLDQLVERLRANTGGLPINELQWITVACWNQGIELLEQKENTDGHKWCQYALKFSGYVNNNTRQEFEKMYLDLSAEK